METLLGYNMKGCLVLQITQESEAGLSVFKNLLGHIYCVMLGKLPKFYVPLKKKIHYIKRKVIS